MPKKGYRCPPGCDCGHHNLPKMTPEEARARKTEQMRTWRAENPERNRENWQRSKAKRRSKQQDYERTVQAPLRRVRRHGLTPEEFMFLFAEQGGRCYLCSKPLSLEKSKNGKQKIHIDHDHSCCPGITSCGDCVRGLACPGCNTAIGIFGDSPERLEHAAAALRAANARVAERIAARGVQGELPLNVTPLKREAKGA